MNKLKKILYFFSAWLLISMFILFYPMLISIYVFFPLLIGVMGYLLIEGIEKGKLYYIFLAIIYFINLEVNLSLPFFLIFIVVLLVYLFIYPSLGYFNECKICKPVLTVVLIDMIYLLFILSYDFLFQTTSVVLDSILIYTLIVDFLVVIVL
ncbi:MAG: hypothetical protein U9O24_09735 [Campylobacterota bacterium]|nr:hypothetical protein [Campylobacterota bacterium]